jgi:hypothetical protein
MWQNNETSVEYKGTAIPLQALTGPEGWVSQISRESTREGGKVVSPTHRPPLPTENIPGTHFCQSAASRIMPMKFSNDTTGNLNRDLPDVAQCLNQLRHRVSVK